MIWLLIWAGFIAFAMRWFHVMKLRDRAEEAAFREWVRR